VKGSTGDNGEGYQNVSPQQQKAARVEHRGTRRKLVLASLHRLPLLVSRRHDGSYCDDDKAERPGNDSHGTDEQTDAKQTLVWSSFASPHIKMTPGCAADDHPEDEKE